LGLRYGARRSLYSRIVAGAIGIGLLVALLLLDAFTHREGFMVGARVYHTLYPDMPYLTDQMALCIAMIVMAGYLPSLAFYGFSDGREISHQHRLEKLYEEECLFEEQRFQAEHADWEKRREQRRKEKPVQEALAALYDLECKSTRLAQITGTRDALLASLNGLIDGRNSVARDYLPNDQKLIEDAYTNLVGSYRLWFTRVQNLVLANDPSLRQQVTFDNETFELLLPDAPARSRVRDPFMLPAEKPEQPAKRSLAARVRSWFRPSARPATE
jgi:hypothetical protein